VIATGTADSGLADSGLAGTGLAGSGLAGTGAVTRPAVTLARGRYLLTGLRPGRYTIGYHDCANPSRYFDQWYGSADQPASATKITITGSQPTRLAPVTLRLTSPAAELAATELAATERAAQASAGTVQPAVRAGWITGLVRSRAGRKLGGICVQASSARAWTQTGSGIAGSHRGVYGLRAGTSGNWEVGFFGGCGNPASWAPQWWRYDQTDRKVTRLRARKGHGFSGIDARLRPGAIITGTVTAADGGKPLGGVCVDAVGTGGMSEVQPEAVTSASGKYRLLNLGTGSYRLRFTPVCGQPGDYLPQSYATTVRATDGKITAGIDAALRTGASISGTVTSQATGAPVAGICVDISSKSGTYGDEDVTDRHGHYTFTGLRAGSYLISYSGGCGNSGSYAPVSYRDQANGYGSDPISVTPAQQLTGIDQAMPPGGTIAGTAAAPRGTPLKDICVLAFTRNAAGGLDGFPDTHELLAPVSLGISGKTGGYRIRDLAPGQYQTEFVDDCASGNTRYAPQIFAPQGGPGWVSVSAGATTAGVSATLSAAGSISGTVTGASGRKLRWICAFAVPGKAGLGIALGQAEDAALTTRDGHYVLHGLAPGRYTVEFSACENGRYAPQWYKGAGSQSTARLVTVRAGHATTGIDAALTVGHTVTGRVTAAASGKPVGRACVLVTDSFGNLIGDGETSASGAYRVTHVPAGRWIAEAWLCQSANPEFAGVVRRVRVHGSSTRLAITLPQAGQVTGTVLGGASTAEPGICVAAKPVSGTVQAGLAVTGAGGRYRMTGLAPGSYRILFTPYCLVGTAAVVPQWYDGAASSSKASLVTVTAGRTTTAVDANLTGDGGISGSVADNSAPVPGVCVGAYAGSARTPAAIAITGTSGSYLLAGLNPGKYTIKFTAGCGSTSYRTQWYDGAASRAAATPVTVSPDSITVGIGAA
jgi:hypothetical protein